MKIKTLTSYFFVTLVLSSCIQEEALNSEAAIDGCTGADVQLANINPDEKIVDVYVHQGANLAKQELIFTLPEGATIKPNSSKEGDSDNFYNFSEEGNSRMFTVTSEDGEYQPTYTINIKPTELPTSYHFERLLDTEKLLIISSMNLRPALRKVYQKFCNGPVVIRDSH